MSATDSPAVSSPGITPRNLRFVSGPPAEHFWMRGDPVETHYYNALSLTFPEGERFFVDAVKQFRTLATGPLAAEVKAFIAQEHLHSREHLALNRLLDPARYPIAEIEAFLARRIGIGRSRPPIVQLLITTALEHFTAIMADDFLRHPEIAADAPEDIGRLWTWHALEETEHKAVAFDVLQRATASWSPLGRWLVRVRAMLLITLLFSSNVATIALRLLRADGYGAWAARWHYYRFLFSRRGPVRRCFGLWLHWFKPGFHPWAHDNRDLLARYRGQFASSDATGVAVAAE